MDEPVMIASAVSFLDSEEEGREALAQLETCPALRHAVEATVAVPTSFEELYALVDAVDAPGYRYCVDGMWTDTLRPSSCRSCELFLTMPTPESSVLLLPWCETDVRNGVFPMQASLYVSPVAAWTDPRDDDRCMAWATGEMRRLEPLSKGIQLADENLVNRPAPFLAPERLERLEALRAQHDPDGLFHSYLLRDA
jgi:hypothetical protein